MSSSRLAKLKTLNPHKLPVHLAVILDGNGRWAKKRGKDRSQGHRAGVEALDRLTDIILDIGIPVISVYAFSTENWKRPKIEVKSLWLLMQEFFKKRIDTCIEKGIYLRTSGDLTPLPAAAQKIIKLAEEKTSGGRKLTLNICLNYGSQNEILHAVDRLIQRRVKLFESGDKVQATAPVKKSEFEKNLYTSPLPDVDLMIRSGGESRLSNYLLWQSAYAEFYVTDTLWPDFNEKDMFGALKWFEGRERKFGAVSGED